MADTTISSLPLGTPSGSDFIPYSTGVNTLATSLSSIPYKIGFSVYDKLNGQIIGDTTVLTYTQKSFTHNCISPLDNLNRFEVPITGLYHFDVYALQYGVLSNAAWQYTYCYVRKNAVNEIPDSANWGYATPSTYYSNKTLAHSTTMFCNKGDFMDVVVKCFGTSSYIDNRKIWTGYLVYPY